MRRAGKRTVGTVAIGLLVAMLMASIFGAAILAAPHSGGSTGSAASHSTSLTTATHSAAPVHPSATTASISILTTFKNYTVIPANVEVQIGSSSSIPDNGSLWISVTDNVFNTFCVAINANKTILTGASFYNISLNPVSLGGSQVACPFITADSVTLNATLLIVDNTSGTPEVASAYATAVTSIVFNPLTATLITPSGSVGAGNVSLVAQYSAQYLTSVRILIYSPGGASLLFNSSLQWVNAQTPAVATWYTSTAGLYPFKLTVTTAYGSLTTSGNITVLTPGGGTIYKNSSTWQNASVFPGVSGAVAGTILLVVGLILGMIVALAVGRSLMRPAAAAPAQPWQPSGTAAANQCSVCGKTFATPEELKEHAKSEHGMS